MAEPSDVERELLALEADLKRLEAEYTMYFSGRLPRPPWELRARVDAALKRLDRARIVNYGERFRFESLQSRFVSFVDLWERGMRAREEGRPGPFPQRAATDDPRPRAEARVVHVATFTDPLREGDKLRELYASVSEARREAGEDRIPFNRFAELVRTQVEAFREKGSPEVAFRVAIKDGRVAFTARGLRGGHS